MREKNSNRAFITVLGDDMGGALIECSNCHQDLHKYTNNYIQEYSIPWLEKMINNHKHGKSLTDKIQEPPPMQCPNCSYLLEWGSIDSYPFGGSDF
jgi:hypothetical protein